MYSATHPAFCPLADEDKLDAVLPAQDLCSGKDQLDVVSISHLSRIQDDELVLQAVFGTEEVVVFTRNRLHAISVYGNRYDRNIDRMLQILVDGLCYSITDGQQMVDFGIVARIPSMPALADQMYKRVPYHVINALWIKVPIHKEKRSVKCFFEFQADVTVDRRIRGGENQLVSPAPLLFYPFFHKSLMVEP